MNKFSVIIRQVVDGKYETKLIELRTDKNINSKAVRMAEINRYLKSNKYNQYCICFDCTLGPKDCPKMADISKKLISEYSFIITGFQVQDGYKDINDNMYSDSELGSCDYERTQRKESIGIEKFVVSKCKKFNGTRRY